MAPMRDACSKLKIESSGTVFCLSERKVVTMGDDGDDVFGTGPAVILIVTTVTIVTLND